MSIEEDGHVSLSIIAGPLEPSELHPRNLFMGSSLCVTIQPHIARQWIQALTPIAAKDTE